MDNTIPAWVPRLKRAHVQQPPGSRLCGPACIAIIAGITLLEAVVIVDVAPPAGTDGRRITRALRRLGYELQFHRRFTGRLPVWPGGLLLARVRWMHRSHGGYHWVVIDRTDADARIYCAYDPTFPHPIGGPTYEELMRRQGAYVTSFFAVCTLDEPAVVEGTGAAA